MASREPVTRRVTNTGDAPKKRATRAERQGDFVSLAADIIREADVRGVTMEALGVRAGVNKSIVYRFFNNREEVLCALYEREAEAFSAQAVESVARSTSVAAMISGFVNVYYDHMAGPDSVYRKLEDHRDCAELERMKAERGASIVAFYVEQMSKEFALPIEEAVTAAAAMGLAAKGVIGVIVATGWDRQKIIDIFVRMSIAGLKELEQPLKKEPSR